MVEIEPDVAANYRALKAERGLTWEQIAEQADGQHDRKLAAWCREQAATDRAHTPKGRAAAPRSEA